MSFPSQPTLLQFWSFEIGLITILNYKKFAALLIVRLENCESAGRVEPFVPVRGVRVDRCRLSERRPRKPELFQHVRIPEVVVTDGQSRELNLLLIGQVSAGGRGMEVVPQYLISEKHDPFFSIDSMYLQSGNLQSIPAHCHERYCQSQSHDILQSLYLFRAHDCSSGRDFYD